LLLITKKQINKYKDYHWSIFLFISISVFIVLIDPIQLYLYDRYFLPLLILIIDYLFKIDFISIKGQLTIVEHFNNYNYNKFILPFNIYFWVPLLFLLFTKKYQQSVVLFKYHILLFILFYIMSIIFIKIFVLQYIIYDLLKMINILLGCVFILLGINNQHITACSQNRF